MGGRIAGVWCGLFVAGVWLLAAPAFAAPPPPAPGKDVTTTATPEPLPGALFYKCEDECCRWYRICGENRYCPRGKCGMEMLDCQRLEYKPYVLTGTQAPGIKPIDAECVPVYRSHCRDFWLHDRCCESGCSCKRRCK
jgi:hypothetical protein